ncbi:MAG: hypothetical protein R3232_01915 [Clostridia bacterium]|nr:hypothetical protein [Clostridia bacterium]
MLFGKSVNDIIENLSCNNELNEISENAFMIMLVLTLIVQAERRKNLAKKLVDRFFGDTPEENEKRKEEDNPKEKGKSRSKK